jgi:hypothetical protein
MSQEVDVVWLSEWQHLFSRVPAGLRSVAEISIPSTEYQIPSFAFLVTRVLRYASLGLLQSFQLLRGPGISQQACFFI